MLHALLLKKFIKSLQKKVPKVKQIIIIGNEKHPEVEGIKGWSKTKVTCDRIQRKMSTEFAYLPLIRKLCIVSQTTFNYNKFKELVEIIEKMGYHIIVLNTICSATKERQDEALGIAGRVDAMIVVGDKQQLQYPKSYLKYARKACNRYVLYSDT